MAIYSQRYYGFPGQHSITIPALANVKILHVARMGLTQSETFNEQAGNMQYIYSAFSGSLTFSINAPFAAINPDGSGSILLHPQYLEKIFVKWKV